MISIAAIVVVYNQRCEDSETCQALLKTKEPITVVVYDNSTQDMGNREQCGKYGWNYLGGDGNKGLSKAYNAAIDDLYNRKWTGIICLFDDDTDIEPEYFEVLRSAAKTTSRRVFVPIIESKGRILSPCTIDAKQRVSLFADPEAVYQYAGDSLTAINSGMALRSDIFADYRYDENIFLDGIDHKFLQDMHHRGEEICVLHYRCNHNFSGDQVPTKASALVRFKIYSHDYGYILRDDKNAYRTLVGKRALHLMLQYHSIIFLKIMRQNRPKKT